MCMLNFLYADPDPDPDPLEIRGWKSEKDIHIGNSAWIVQNVIETKFRIFLLRAVILMNHLHKMLLHSEYCMFVEVKPLWPNVNHLCSYSRSVVFL